MGYTFAAKPDFDPSGPKTDGFANVRFTHEGMVLELAEGKTVLVPCITIHKASMVIKPGCDTQVNMVQLELLTGEVEVQDDSYVDEFAVQLPLVMLPIVGENA